MKTHKRKNRKQKQTRKKGGSITNINKDNPKYLGDVATSSILSSKISKDRSNYAQRAAFTSGSMLGLKIVATAIISSSSITPAGPAILIVLIIARKLAQKYENNQILKNTMYDVMNIVSNCYRMNELLDKSIQTFFIYIFNHKHFYGLIKKDEIERIDKKINKKQKKLEEKKEKLEEDKKAKLEEKKEKLEEDNKEKAKLEEDNKEKAKLEEDIIKLTSRKNELYQLPESNFDILFKEATENAKGRVKEYQTGNKLNFVFSPQDVFETNKIEEEDRTSSLIGKIQKNRDIDSRLFDKIKELTVFLLKLMPTPDIIELNKDPKIKNSSFGDLLKEEMNKRNLIRDDKESTSFSEKIQKGVSSVGKTISSASALALRMHKRIIDPEKTINKIVRDLSIINGFSILMKSQYDFQMDYYERELLPSEYKKIWNYIEKQDEYQFYLVPANVEDSVDIIYSKEFNSLNKLNSYEGAEKAVEAVEENKIDDVRPV